MTTTVRSRQVDKKGRVTIGLPFAGRMVSIQETTPSTWVVTLVPRKEEWLYRNKDALASVQRGLAQAKAGEVSEVDLVAAKVLADQCED